jgi:hypothetical protein
MVLLIAVERLGRSVTAWRELVSCKNERIVVKCSRRKGYVAIDTADRQGFAEFSDNLGTCGRQRGVWRGRQFGNFWILETRVWHTWRHETVWGGLHDLVERAMALVAEHLGLPVARQMMSRGMDKDRKAGTEELLDEVDQCGGGAVHDSGG